MKPLIHLAERGFLPDFLIRQGIRYFNAKRLRDEREHDVEYASIRYQKLLDELRTSPIAESVDEANKQHYEVSTEFFKTVLGPALKYSSAYWDEGVSNLAAAEIRMLELYAQRAEIEDGMSILDLGCGWGSFALWAASEYPQCTIFAVSNSRTQKSYIDSQAESRGLSNVTVLTSDVNSLTLTQRFDRVISIEMFEHVRNYDELMRNIASWLLPDGKLFVHVFCHRYLMYPFELDAEDDWIAQLFFANGLMPSRDTLLHFQQDLTVENRWEVSGTHYRKTAAAWTQRLKQHRARVLTALSDSHPNEERLVFNRWKIFFLACEELFGWKQGSSWIVAHYLFSKGKLDEVGRVED